MFKGWPFNLGCNSVNDGLLEIMPRVPLNPYFLNILNNILLFVFLYNYYKIK